jgi:DNA-binding NtrC family response regulator
MSFSSSGAGTSAPSNTKSQEPTMAPAENGKTILLAEYDKQIRTFVFKVLQQNGYHVITGVDGKDALDKSRQFKGTIDLLLSDFKMPHMNGIELATKMQIERPVIRVLLMSGTVSEVLPPNEEWEVLPKPFGLAALEQTIQHLLQEEAHGAAGVKNHYRGAK